MRTWRVYLHTLINWKTPRSSRTERATRSQIPLSSSLRRTQCCVPTVSRGRMKFGKTSLAPTERRQDGKPFIESSTWSINSRRPPKADKITLGPWGLRQGPRPRQTRSTAATVRRRARQILQFIGQCGHHREGYLGCDGDK